MSLFDELISIKCEPLTSRKVAEIITNFTTEYDLQLDESLRIKSNISALRNKFGVHNSTIFAITDYKLVTVMAIDSYAFRFEIYLNTSYYNKEIENCISRFVQEDYSYDETIVKCSTLGIEFDGDLTFDIFLPKTTKSARTIDEH
jgi:hypothetical protein